MKAPVKTISANSKTYEKVSSLANCMPANSFAESAVFTDAIVGVSNKDWKVTVAKGGDASSPYSSSTLREFKPLMGTVRSSVSRCPNPTWHDEQWLVHFTSGPELYFDVSVPSDLTIRDIALSILKRKLSDDLKMHNAAIPLAELREFHGLIGSMADLSVGFFNRYGRLLNAKQSAKAVYHYASEAWLAYSFGIKPMINDAQAIAESIAQYQYGKDFYQRYTGTFGTTYLSTASTYAGQPSIGPSPKISWRLEHELSYQFIAGIRSNMYSSNDYSLFSHLGLDSLDILPSVGWELLPYSWVYDYFTNIGDYLEDVWTRKPYNTRYVVECKRHSVRVVGDYNPGSPAQAGTQYICHQKPSWIKTSFTRTPLASLPSRSLRFKTLYEISNNPVNKLLNLISVLGVKTHSRVGGRNYHL